MDLSTKEATKEQALHNRLWVPSATEVYTEEGWMSVALAFNIAPRLLTADTEKRTVYFEQSRGWSSMEFSGKINKVTEGLLKMQFRDAFPVDKSEVLDVSDIAPATMRQLPYTGQLYSFDVPSGIVMLRGQVKADAGMTSMVAHVVSEVYGDEDIIDFDCGADDDMPEWWMSWTRW